MRKSLALNKKTVAEKTLIVMVAVLSAIVLPQLVHAVGVLSETESVIGSILLPMHIPVILAGFIGGPVVGIATGVFSPLISFGISGMPSAVILPFMVIELGVYGLISGLLSYSKFNSFSKLIITQLAGRVSRVISMIIAINFLNNTSITIEAVKSFIVLGLVGMVIQWTAIPVLYNKLNGLKSNHE